MLVKRTLLPSIAILLATAPAMAAPHAKPKDPSSGAKAACLAAHEEGQKLRTDKKLHAAREKYVACAKSECPAVIRKECAEQIESLESQAPSLAFEAIDEKGNADPAVRVSIDGTVAAERLTGASVNVEPGEHTIKFDRADGKMLEQKVIVSEGEKNRKIVGDFGSLVPKPQNVDHGSGGGGQVEPAKIPIGTYIAGGVSLVALGSFTVFALTGKSKEDDLAGKCAPTCTADEVGSVDRSYLIADVSLGVAVVAAVVAVVLAIPALGSSGSVKTASASALGPAPWFPKKRVLQ